MAAAYIRFAHGKPEVYRTFIHTKPAEADPMYGAWLSCYEPLAAALSRCVRDDLIGACSFTMWSMMHGRLELTWGSHSAMAADDGLEDAVLAIVAGYQ